ncbi:hypothetical protein [Nocardia aurantiaca]|uniref:Secreted protein n=1 Tax=Nocardia aurantiaca TaxID=2675850 RepID=A0A6I3L3B7_9NOCA|nr:hypothetical protein [Nocardia aurantiaca]MTE14379.1 hypothetical protein [Nocardia aurantiaca]
MNPTVRIVGWTATVVAVTCAGLASAPFAGADATAPAVNDCLTNQAEVQPADMLLACGDGGLSVRDITWSSWGRDSAEGDGTEHRRVCQPSCAAGRTATATTHITLRKPQDGYFTEAAITDLDGKPETWPVSPPRR